MRRRVLAFAGLLLGGAVLGGCLGEPIEPAPSADAAVPPGHGEHHDEAQTTRELGAPDLILDAHAGTREKDLQLHPTPMRVPLGSVVELRVTNRGYTPHTFTIHEFDADTGMMNPGETRVIKFRADNAGTFETMCDAPGHYEAGMKGTIEVTA